MAGRSDAVTAAAAGYSGTPLARKLGIVPGVTVALLGPPHDFARQLDPPEGTRVVSRLGGRPDVIVFFATRRAALERRLPALMRALPADGGLWIAWPKRSSGLDSDLSENLLREVILPTGLVDNKVCAVNQAWSGLRFVVRKANREAWGGPG